MDPAFFDGIPLYAAKKGFFQSRTLGKVLQMAKLIYNGAVYNFSAGTNGAVYMDPAGLNWHFVIPDREDITLDRETKVWTFLEELKAHCEENPIPAWSEFAEWLYGADILSMVQTLVSATVKITDRTYSTTEIPAFSMPDNGISNIFDWLLKVEKALDPNNYRVLSHFVPSGNNTNKLLFPITLTVQNTDDGSLTDVSMKFVVQK